MRSQIVAARQEIARRVVELLAHIVDDTGVVPVAAIARIPDAAASPVVEIAAEPTGTEAAVGIAGLTAGIRLRVALTRLALLTLLALLALLPLLALARLRRAVPDAVAA